MTLHIKNFIKDNTNAIPAFVEAINTLSNGILLQFDGKDFNCRAQNGNFCFYSPTDGWDWEVESALSLEFDEQGHTSAYSLLYFPYTGKPKDHGFLGGMYQNVQLEEKGGNLILMHCRLGHLHIVSNHLIMTYATREYPGIFAKESKDVSLEDIRLYHTAFMGGISFEMCDKVVYEKLLEI